MVVVQGSCLYLPLVHAHVWGALHTCKANLSAAMSHVNVSADTAGLADGAPHHSHKFALVTRADDALKVYQACAKGYECFIVASQLRFSCNRSMA